MTLLACEPTPVLPGYYIFTREDDKHKEINIPDKACLDIITESTKIKTFFKYCSQKPEAIEIKSSKEINITLLNMGLTPEVLGL